MVPLGNEDIATDEILRPHFFACMDMAYRHASLFSQCFPVFEAWVEEPLEESRFGTETFLAW